MEITLEKIELVKDRTGVTYAEAKQALEENDGSVVDAIIDIEETVNAGKKERNFGDRGSQLFGKLKALVKKGNVSRIKVKREDDTILNVPVNAGILGIAIAPLASVVAVVAAFGFKCVIEVVKELSENGVKVIIDSDADVLSRCKGIKLYAVKLNDSNIDGDVKKAAAYYLDNGVENVLYSSPGKPSFVFTKEEILECDNQADSLVNAIGSADSMVAGFIYGSLRGATTIESFKYANAASIATCMSNDLGSKEKIEELFTTIEVKNI